MAFKEITLTKYASDLVIAHKSFHFSNDNANITPLATALPLGTVVTRPVNSAPRDAWKVIAADADVVDGDELAVVFGDHYAFKYDFIPRAIAAGKWNAVVVRRDAAFKEFYIKANLKATLSAAKYAQLIQNMANQGLLVLEDVSDFKVA